MDTEKMIKDLRTQRDRIEVAIAALVSLNGSGSQQSAPRAVVPSKAADLVPTAMKGHQKKRVISPEGRQRMADAQQKRWKEKKKVIAKKAAAAAKAESVTS